MLKVFTYIDGDWVVQSEAKVSLFDLSVIRGYGIFDYTRSYKKKPFKLSEHIDRLFNSGKELGIAIPATKSHIEKVIYDGIAKNSFPDYSIRIVVTGGVSPDGITKGGKPTLAVLFSKAVDYPEKYYTNGASVITKKYERIVPHVKSINYLVAIDALAQAKKKQAIEVLYISYDGKILEGTTSNFFAVIGGKIVTPKENILSGITREIVIDLARKLQIPVIETDVLFSQSLLFDEVFITASNKEVMPIVKIDQMKIGNGKVGNITKKLIFAYRELIKK